MTAYLQEARDVIGRTLVGKTGARSGESFPLGVRSLDFPRSFTGATLGSYRAVREVFENCRTEPSEGILQLLYSYRSLSMEPVKQGGWRVRMHWALAQVQAKIANHGYR